MSDAAADAPPEAAAGELKYRGVRKRKWGRYVSEIRLPNSRERIWLGSYDTAEKAARAFDAALFCLRGRAANFNFSNDPPDIAGGRSLSRAEILTVAQHYGNSYGGSPTSRAAAFDDNQFRAEARALEGVATTSSGFDWAGPVDLIDGSFWEMVDMQGGGSENIAGCVSGFGLSPEPGEMYVNPQYHDEARVYENEYECYDHVLWNF